MLSVRRTQGRGWIRGAAGDVIVVFNNSKSHFLGLNELALSWYHWNIDPK